jgi:hypothetical protein
MLGIKAIIDMASTNSLSCVYKTILKSSHATFLFDLPIGRSNRSFSIRILRALLLPLLQLSAQPIITAPSNNRLHIECSVHAVTHFPVGS